MRRHEKAREAFAQHLREGFSHDRQKHCEPLPPKSLSPARLESDFPPAKGRTKAIGLALAGLGTLTLAGAASEQIGSAGIDSGLSNDATTHFATATTERTEHRSSSGGAALGDFCPEGAVSQNPTPNNLVFPNIPVCLDPDTGFTLETLIAESWPAGELSQIGAIKFAATTEVPDGGPFDIDIEIYQGDINDLDSLTLIASEPFTIPAGVFQDFLVANFDPVVVPDPSEPVVIAFRFPDLTGITTASVFPGGNESGDGTSTYIWAPDCGVDEFATMSDIDFDDANLAIQICAEPQDEPFCGDDVCTPDEDCVSCPEDCGECIFGEAQFFGSMDNPFHVRIADLNDNGNLDIVMPGNGDDAVAVLLGNGDGTFTPQQTYPVGNWPRDVAIGDYNGDGILDLAVANLGSDTVSILSGNGDGTFTPQETFPAGIGPTHMKTADLNDNENLDLVVINGPGDEISILLGNGDGTFAPPDVFDAAGGSPRAVVIEDLNGNGILDLAVPNRGSDNVAVFFGNGDGTFALDQTYAATDFPFGIASADFNGNGIPDLAVTNSGGFGSTGTTVSVYLGNGDGTFAPQVQFLVGFSPKMVAAEDVNGDGIPDLVVANRDSDNISILLGNGDGTFASQQIAPVPGGGPQGVAIGDFDGNGTPDVAVSNQFSDNAAVLLNQLEPDIPGDLTGDGEVGVGDLLVLLGEWGPCDDCEDCPADLNDNCEVGVGDLLILLANWTG